MSDTNSKSPKDKSEKKSFSFSKLIYNDKYLFFLSVILAVVVWITSSLSVGTEETRTIKVDVPIKLGDQVSEQLGMQYYTLQDTVEVSVSVSGAKYVVGQVSENDLEISFDTSSVTKTGEQRIPIIVNNKSKSLDFSVDAVYPSSVDGYFDVNSVKTFDVKLNFDSENVADGYVFGTPVLSDDKVVVSGPKTYVDRITDAYCDVNFGEETGLVEQFTQDCDIKFGGDGIITNYLTVTSRNDNEKEIKNISVTLPVLKIVNLPVSTAFEDKPEGIDDSMLSVSYSVDTIRAGVLSTADISTANLGVIYFSDLTVGTQTIEFPTDKLNGVTVLDNVPTIKATVTVSSNYTEQVIRVNKNDITVDGKADGEDMSVVSMDDVSVTVLVPKGTNISASDLSMRCDVTNKTNDNKYPVRITVNNNQCWVYGHYNAIIK